MTAVANPAVTVADNRLRLVTVVARLARGDI
jgi:hypothetical protein